MAAPKPILDPDEFMATQEELDPDAFMAQGTPPARTAPPPPPPGLLSKMGSFLFGAEGGPGGLSDVLPYSITHPIDTAKAWAGGLAPLAEESQSMAPGSGTGVLPGRIEALIPGGPIALGAGRGIIESSVEQFKKSREGGRGLVTSTLSATPLIGPAATQVGEALTSEDPRQRAAGVGSALALLSPVLVKGTGAALRKSGITPAIERVMANGVVKSYARAMEPPSKKLALAAREVTPVLAGEKLHFASPQKLIRLVENRTHRAGNAVDATIKFHSTIPIDKDALIARIEATKAPHVNPLTNQPFTPESANAVATISDIVKQVETNLGPAPTVADLHRYRKAMDHMVTKGQKEKLYAELAKTGKLSYYKEVADILRDTLNKSHDDIAKANSNFTQWATARTVVREAKKAREAGEITGGGGMGMYARLGFAGVALRAWHALTLRHSTRWQTLMGGEKQAILKGLQTGEFGPEAEAIIMSNVLLKPKKEDRPVYFPALAPPPPPPELENLLGALP